MTVWWRWYVLAGTVVVAAYSFVPAGIPQGLVYLVLGLTSVVAIVVGVRLNRPAASAAWYWVAAGQLLSVTGDAMYTWYEEVAGVSAFPSPADIPYLAAYPLIATGLVLLIRSFDGSSDLAGLIDSTIVTIGLGLVSWVVLAGPMLEATDDPWLARVTGLAYPAADIVLLALLVRLVVGPRARSTAFRLLAGSIGLLLVADTGFSLITVHSSYDGGAFDLVWLASYVLAGAAALHPSTRGAAEEASEAAPFSRGRLVALMVVVLIAPGMLGVQMIVGLPLEVGAVTVCSVALFALVVARMSIAMEAIRASTRQRDLLQDDLAHQAAHDSLTDLANRAFALETIEAALHRGQRAGAIVGLLFVDLDHFKIVNDSHGHAAGDEVLRQVALRMRRRVRAGDTVGRIGGDEFVVLVERPESESTLVLLADRLLAAIAEPVRFQGRELHVGASIGVAVSRDGSTDADQLLHEADSAAYRAKDAGRGRVEIFDDGLRAELREQTRLEKAMRHGLEHGELVLHYQSVVDISTGRVDGYEALVRWERPGFGLVQPDDFIPAAEKSNLVCEIDRWVLREATRQLASWTESHPEDGQRMTVAVNISGRHLASASVVTDVAAALAESGLPACRLVLEITETVLVEQPTASAHLAALRALGVGLSLDDFGTGYTSINQLQHLSVDTLKIDKSLVESAAPGASELVRLVVHAAHAFGLRVVAEGVEEEAQLDFLHRFGCDWAQGFLFARPQPASVITTSLTRASRSR